MIEVELPDGTVVEFPTDTSPDTIKQVLGRQFPEQQQAKPRSLNDRAAQFMQRAGDMVPFADEIRSAGYLAQELGGNALSGEETEGGVGGAWERARERDRQGSEIADRNVQGLERVAADTLGLSTAIAAPLKAAPKLGLNMPAASTAAGRVGQAATVGTVGGGVVGAGEGEGLEERAANTLGGMVLGGVAGGGIGGALEGGAALARSVPRMFPPASQASAQSRAVQRVARRLNDDDLTADAARRRISEMRQAGTQPSLMETGPSTRQLGRVVRDQPGAGTQKLDDFVENRAQDIPRTVRGRVDDSLMPEPFRMTAPDAVKDQYVKAVREHTRPLYANISGTVSGRNKTVRHVLSTPSGRQAVAKAERAARDFGEPFPGIYDDRGNVRPLEAIDIRALHRVRQALDDVAGFSKQNAQGSKEASVRRLRGMLDSVLKSSSKELARADATHEFFMKGVDGLSVGKQFDRMSAEQLRAWIKKATPPQRAMARIAAANRFGGRIQDMADPTTQLREGGNRLEAVKALFGDAKSADDFARHVAAQREIAATRQIVNQGSLTSRNLANMDDEAAQMIAEFGVDTAATGGNPMSALLMNARRLVGRVGRISDAERRVLIDMLTETDPQKLSVIFGDIADAQSRMASGAAARATAANTAAGATALANP